MDSMPTYADLIGFVGTVAFWLGYVAAILLQLANARRVGEGFAMMHIAVALLVGIFGSVLSLVFIFLFFRHA